MNNLRRIAVLCGVLSAVPGEVWATPLQELASIGARIGVEVPAVRFPPAPAAFSAATSQGTDTLERAVQAMKDLNLPEAVRLYTLAINSGQLGAIQRGYAYSKRGLCRYYLKEIAESLPDFTEAIRLTDDGDAHLHRGPEVFILGRLEEAKADYRWMAETFPDFEYAIILHSLRTRTGDDDAEEFSRNLAKAVIYGEWDETLIGIFKGKNTPDELLQLTADIKKDSARKRRGCMAYFHLAEHALIAKDKETAAKRFMIAASACDDEQRKNFALAELRRIRE